MYAVRDRDRIVFSAQYGFTNYGDLEYRVISVKEAERDFAQVEEVLAGRVGKNGPENYAADGYAAWVAAGGESQEANGVGVMGLVDHVDDMLAGSGAWPHYGMGYVREFRLGLERVAHAARWYWATVVFEMVYFAGVVWWCVWPWVRGWGFWRKVVQVGAVPLVLALPLWLGYCNLASPSAPRGGVLYVRVIYPWVAVGSGVVGNYEWEVDGLSRMPPVLEPLTQGRAVGFADYYTMRTSAPVFPGPVGVAVEGAVLAGVYAGFHGVRVLVRKWRRRVRERPGFPVEVGSGGEAVQ
jgi:hypothetical protein